MSLPAGENGTGDMRASWDEIHRLDNMVDDRIRIIVSKPNDEIIRIITELMRNAGLIMPESYGDISGTEGLVIGTHIQTGQRLEVILTDGRIVYRRHNAEGSPFVIGQPPNFYSQDAKKVTVYHRTELPLTIMQSQNLVDIPS